MRSKAAVRVLTLLLLTWFVPPTEYASAQRDSPFEIGELLRFSAPTCGIEHQVARYLRLYRDTLTVQAETELRVPVAGITRLDVSRGFSNQSTLVGVAAGAVAGLLVGIAVASDEGTTYSPGITSEQRTPPAVDTGEGARSGTMSGAIVAPMAGTLIGAFVGGLMGKAAREHRWEEVPLDRLRVEVTPRGDNRIVIGLSFSL